MIRRLLVLFVLLVPAAAHGEWHEATSANFVVYTEGSQDEARAYATKLEKFNFVLRRYHNVREVEAAPRFRVFLLENVDAVQRMLGNQGVGGYYVPDARGLMFVGTRRAGSNRRFDPETILFHEYVHHFMFQYFPAAYPVWYSEGYAEFWGTTRFLDNDVVEVGLPQEGRFGSFGAGRWVPLGRLLTARSYGDVPQLDLLYAQGWLLCRYLFENRARHAQVTAYLRDINAGMSYRDAMTRHLGADAAQLDAELFAYAGRVRFNVVRLPFRAIDVGPVAVRTLGPAEQALIEQEVKLSQGVSIQNIAERAAAIRERAGRFPDDPFALALVAEAEQLAGNLPAARAAVDRLLAAHPNDARALMRRGRLEIERLRAAGSADRAAWEAARRDLNRAIDLAPNDPLVHEALYDSYVAEGVLPPDAAQNALYTAHELAPSDSEINYKLARDFEQRDMIREAITIIRPDANLVRLRPGETEAQRRERERREDRNRQAGTVRHETARDMLTRLEARLAGAAPAAARN